MLLREQESNLLVGYSAAAIICLLPVQSGLHLPIASLSCGKPDYLRRLSGANDIILNWVEERTGVEPAKRFRIAAMVCRVTLATWLYRSRLAEITRPAIGID